MNKFITSYPNPDTDGVACMLALNCIYKEYTPVIRGNISPETKYVLEKIGLNSPEIVEGLDELKKSDGIILVDTHHRAQLGKDFPFGRVTLVIDHHPDGDDGLFRNARIDNRKIGAAASIAGEMLLDRGGVDAGVAQLLQYAIVSNTLNFKALSCDAFDKEIFNRLSEISRINDTDLAGMLKCEKTSDISATGLISSDLKFFDTLIGKIAISQMEGQNLSVDLEEIQDALDEMCDRTLAKHAIFNGVDTKNGKSMVIFSRNARDGDIKEIFGFDAKGGVSLEDRILLRKTDFIPSLKKYYNINALLSSGNYIVVFDTCVLLNIYRYSPEFAEFALECLNAEYNNVKLGDYIYLPATVFIEYKRHYRSEYSKMRNKVRKTCTDTTDAIERMRSKVFASCAEMENRKFPDAEVLRGILNDGLDDLKSKVEDFFDERKDNLEAVLDAWGSDRVQEFVIPIEQGKRVFMPFSQEQLYKLCDEGEKRYGKGIPPGYMDAKKKDGIRKYSDLILWKEIIRYAKANRKNIIFVTDDIKPDWWEVRNGESFFHQKLYDEFHKETEDGNGNCMEIIPLISTDFYDEVSESFFVDKSDLVELVLNLTDEEYCEKVQERVFDLLWDKINNTGEEFVNTETAHIGSEGLDELQVTDYKFVGGERVDRDGDEFVYHFCYDITAEGTSYEYWGRDGREIITSDGCDHVFEGRAVAEVRRIADVFLDLSNDTDFMDVKLIDCELEETSYIDREDDIPGAYSACGHCGRPIYFENDAGNGYCVECTREHDF